VNKKILSLHVTNWNSPHLIFMLCSDLSLRPMTNTVYRNRKLQFGAGLAYEILRIQLMFWCLVWRFFRSDRYDRYDSSVDLDVKIQLTYIKQ